MQDMDTLIIQILKDKRKDIKYGNEKTRLKPNRT